MLRTKQEIRAEHRWKRRRKERNAYSGNLVLHMIGRYKAGAFSERRRRVAFIWFVLQSYSEATAIWVARGAISNSSVHSFSP